MVIQWPRPIDFETETTLLGESRSGVHKINDYQGFYADCTFRLDMRRTAAGSIDVTATMRETSKGRVMETRKITLDQNKYVNLTLNGQLNLSTVAEIVVEFDSPIDELDYSLRVRRLPAFTGR